MINLNSYRFPRFTKLPEWERTMLAIYRGAEKKENSNIEVLYDKLNEAFQRYFEYGTVKSGESFMIEIGGLCPYKQVFYEECSEIYNVNEKTKEEYSVISKDDLSNGREKLKSQEQLLYTSGVTIGRRYPEGFVECLKNLKPRQMVTFDEGKGYICMRNDGLTVVLLEVFSGKLTDFTIDNFKDNLNNFVYIFLDDKRSVQKFYIDNKKKLTSSVEMRVIDIDNARNITGNMYDKLSKFYKTEVKIGPVKLKAKKDIFEKGGILWYNNGKRVSGDVVNWLIGYLESEPIKISYIRNKSNSLTELYDEMFAQDMEECIKSGNISLMLKIMKGYIEEHNGDLKVRIDTYEKEKYYDGAYDYIAVSYLLIMDKGSFKVCKRSYANNNFKNKADATKQITEQELEDFFEKKYAKEHTLVIARSLCAINDSCKGN